MGLAQVNPTRMELTKQKKKLRVATRGHKLLKDKRDELMKQFLEMVRENKKLRILVEEKLGGIYSNFLIASALMSKQVLEQAVSFPKQRIGIELSTKNIMSVDVPVFEVVSEKDTDDLYAYSFFGTSSELDVSINNLKNILPHLLELAEKEKSSQLLAAEIEKTRRRVNALEYVMIPQLTTSIKFITMKLDENERGNLTRLMKVKDMMIKEQMQKQALQHKA